MGQVKETEFTLSSCLEGIKEQITNYKTFVDSDKLFCDYGAKVYAVSRSDIEIKVLEIVIEILKNNNLDNNIDIKPTSHEKFLKRSLKEPDPIFDTLICNYEEFEGAMKWYIPKSLKRRYEL